MLEQIQPMVKPKLELRICGCEVAVALITLSGCLFKVNINFAFLHLTLSWTFCCAQIWFFYIYFRAKSFCYFFTAIDGWFSLKLN